MNYFNISQAHKYKHPYDYYTYIDFDNTKNYLIDTYNYLNNYNIQINILHLSLFFTLYLFTNFLFYISLKKYIDYKFSKISLTNNNNNNNLLIKRKFDDENYNRFFLRRNPKRKCNMKKDD